MLLSFNFREDHCFFPLWNLLAFNTTSVVLHLGHGGICPLLLIKMNKVQDVTLHYSTLKVECHKLSFYKNPAELKK